MDNRYYDVVIAEMQSFIDENGFKETNGIFKNEGRAFKVEYDEARQMYLLLTAEVTEEGVGEFGEGSAWLFDDSQTEKDAPAVGIDFTETLKKQMGIKTVRAATAANAVDLPTVKKGEALNISGFTKRVLDVFPQYKESYKEHVAKYGNFLYISFFSDTLIVQIRAALIDGNKKQLKKIFELLENGYLKGDRETVDYICAAVAAVAAESAELKAAADDMLQSNTHFRDSVRSLTPIIAKKAKLNSVIDKK